MSKIIILEECFDCQNYVETMLFCGKTNKTVPDETKIPIWCPLPDYQAAIAKATNAE